MLWLKIVGIVVLLPLVVWGYGWFVGVEFAAIDNGVNLHKLFILLLCLTFGLCWWWSLTWWQERMRAERVVWWRRKVRWAKRRKR